MMILARSFYERPTIVVAQELLGCTLVFQGQKGLITETEAYIGQDDPACHAAKGRTQRTDIMFGPAGFSYVYLIYGMYHCLNFVTEGADFPAAVLIRGIKMSKPDALLLDGPGKLCKALGITREHNGWDITQDESFSVLKKDRAPPYVCSPRIGIKKGLDKYWRFVVQSG